MLDVFPLFCCKEIFSLMTLWLQQTLKPFLRASSWGSCHISGLLTLKTALASKVSLVPGGHTKTLADFRETKGMASSTVTRSSFLLDLLLSYPQRNAFPLYGILLQPVLQCQFCITFFLK